MWFHAIFHRGCAYLFLEFAYPIENLSDKNVKIHHVNIVVTNFTVSNYEITSVKINIGWVLKKRVKIGWDVQLDSWVLKEGHNWAREVQLNSFLENSQVINLCNNHHLKDLSIF
jgi:hypothetical protein